MIPKKTFSNFRINLAKLKKNSSNILLGNVQEAKKSRKYYRSLAVGEAADIITSAPPDPQLPQG